MEDILSVPQTDIEYELEEITPIINKWLLTLSKKRTGFIYIEVLARRICKKHCKAMEHIFKQTFRQTFQIKKQFKTGTRKGGHISMKNNDEILYNSISNIDENIIASSLAF